MSPTLMVLALLVGQCRDGACRPSPVTWRTRADEPHRVYLFVDGQQRGGYDGLCDQWRDYDPQTHVWSEPRPLFPACTGTRIEDEANFGVMRDRLTREECYSLNGVPVTEGVVRQAFEAIPDDSRSLRLTIIGPGGERQAVLRDLEQHPALAEFRGRLRVQSYEPDHWTVAGTGFVVHGSPTIYLQTADGRVLHRQDEYRGPQRLAAVLRKADPNYRPEVDPNLDTTPMSRMPGWGWAAIAAVSLLFVTRRRNIA